MTPRVAIVTTLRDAAATLGSFLAYHRALGFKHFFLFFDDPADPMLDWARTQPDVTATPRDHGLQESWRRLVLWNEVAAHVETEVMARQLLNAEHAMNLARASGFDWLLHIDSDELFYVPGGDALAHFTALGTTPVEVSSYINLEAVPETEDGGDFFRSITLFKTPLTGLPPPPAQALIARAGLSVDTYFHFYGNGKSVVRLGAPGMLPTDVHTFGRRGPYNVIRNRGPFILHYACCGFAAFWQKYVTLGRFSDKWWGKFDIAQAVGPFHLQARDAVMDAVAANDVERARRFYRDRLMMTEPLITEMMQHNLLQRIDEPRKILSR